ncbi:MAG: DUF2163 domain-containing protein [Robiginitomaculum sp.]|nr:DUF2163 domain-containing protein [Robiginitomaculum sp.]
MRNFSPAFAAHISGEATTLCWVWKLSRADGAVLGFTDHDNNLTIDGTVYQAASGFSPADIDSRLGFALDNSSAQGLLSSDVISDADVRAGKYDSAVVEISRVNWANVSESALIWKGKLGDITVQVNANSANSNNNGHFEAELVGQAAVLERSTGRVFARGFDARFGDMQCGLDVSNFPVGTVCPRTYAICQSQFNNTINFRGFPYLIGEDAAYAAPRDGDVKDGSSRY